MHGPSLLLHLLDGGVPLVLVGYLQFDEERFAALIVDLLDLFLAPLLVAPGDEDGRSFVSKEMC
jgi:hypothetical protein